MDKFVFDNQAYVKLDDLKYEIRKLRSSINTRHSSLDDWQKSCMQLAYNDIVKVIFQEEYYSTNDPDEREAVIEMEGSFIIIKKCTIDSKPCYFVGYYEGEPRASCESSDCMIFSYESTARQIAKSLEGEWEVVDVSAAAHNEIKKLIAIFSDELKEKDPENPVLDEFKDRIEEITEESKERFHNTEND